MSTIRPRLALDWLRIVELRCGVRPGPIGEFCGDPSVRAVGLAVGERVVSRSGFGSTMPCERHTDFVAPRIRRFWCSSEVRRFCSGGSDGNQEAEVEGGLLTEGGTADEDVKVRTDRKHPVHYLLPIPELHGKSTGEKSKWPWVSLVPCDSSRYIGRFQKDDYEGKVGLSNLNSQDRALVESSLSLRPSLPRDRNAKRPLQLLRIDVPVKICRILNKYGWSAGALLELRTMIADGIVLKPRHVLSVLNNQRYAEVAFNFMQWALKEVNCKLDVRCFTVVMRLLGRVRKYDLVEILMEDLKQRNYVLDKIMFTVAMRCYAQGQRMQEALELFVKMKNKGLKPDCVAYSVLIQMFSKARLYQEALKLYDDMLALGVSTDTQLYNCVVGTFAKAGRLDVAYEKLAEMRERGHIPDQFTYGVLIEGYAKAGRLEFLDLYREMQAAGVPPNEVIFNIMFTGIERLGTLQDAENVFADMERVGLSGNLNSFSALISMCSKEGNAEGAQLWFERMQNKALQPTIAVGNSLLDGYGRAKQFEQAKEILDSFQEWGLTPNLTTLTACVRCLSLCERDRDFKLVHSMLSCHTGSEFLTVLLGGSAGMDFSHVIASFISSLHFERREDRLDFLNVLINYLYKDGYRSQAYQVWEGALANRVFPPTVDQGSEGICSIHLKGLECGTAIVVLTHTFPRLGRQFHRVEMAPEWVQIHTAAYLRGRISTPNPNPVYEAVGMLLESLHSPFRSNSLKTGFICRGGEVVHWLDEPQIKNMLIVRY